jgi:hypothetical protein
VDDSKLEIKSQLAMLGKEASPSKHCSGPDLTACKVGKLNTALVDGTSWRETLWVWLGLVSYTKQVLTPEVEEALWEENKKSPSQGIEYSPGNNKTRISGWEIKSQL